MNTMTATRKPQGYLANMKRDLDEKRRALADRTKALAHAEAKVEKERAKLPPEPPRGQPMSEAAAESFLERKRPFFEAEDAVKSLASEVSELEGAVRKLSVIVEAPERIKTTLAAFRAMSARRRELRAEADRNAKWQRTLEGRIATAKASAEMARRAAVAKMESGGAGLSVPESIARASDEIRFAEEALADAISRGSVLNDELRTLPARLRDARHEYFHYRWVVADTERWEKLLPLMPVLARAQVARCAVDSGADLSKVEIPISRDAIDAAKEAFASELAEDGE